MHRPEQWLRLLLTKRNFYFTTNNPPMAIGGLFWFRAASTRMTYSPAKRRGLLSIVKEKTYNTINSALASPEPNFVLVRGGPTENRTPLSALKGQRPNR